MTGRPEIWETLKAVVNLVAEGDIATAQSILDAAAITVPTGDLKNGVYDEVGNLYQMPEHIISDPQNLILDPPKDLAGETSVAPSDDDEEIERRREEKGKSVLNTGNLIEVKARLSDRGGPDAIVTMERDQNVRVLSRRIEEEVRIQQVRILAQNYQADCLLQRYWAKGRSGSLIWEKCLRMEKVFLPKGGEKAMLSMP